MERALDLILEIHIGTWEEGQQVLQVGRHFIKQVRLYERKDGWRGRRAAGQPVFFFGGFFLGL
jgi:hypothetical protein